MRDARIRQLKLVDVDITGRSEGSNNNTRQTGALAGVINSPNTNSPDLPGLIEKVSVTGKISSKGTVGGLVGEIGEDIHVFIECSPQPCRDDKDIIKPSTTILHSSTQVSINAHGRIGGLVGWLDGGNIISSYSKSDINNPTQFTSTIGGLVGRFSHGVIKANFSPLTPPPNRIISSFADGQVTNKGITGAAGGLAGSQSIGTQIIASYSSNTPAPTNTPPTPAVEADDAAAGITGRWASSAAYNIIKNSYSRSLGVKAGSFKYGLIAKKSISTGDNPIVINSHWDRMTTGDGNITTSNGVHIIRSIAGSGYSSDQLRGSADVSVDNPGYLPGTPFVEQPTTADPYQGWEPTARQDHSPEEKLALYCDDNGDGVIQKTETTAIWNMGTTNEYPYLNCITKDVQT